MIGDDLLEGVSEYELLVQFEFFRRFEEGDLERGVYLLV